MSKPANPVTLPLALYTPHHFLLKVNDGVATVTLNRPERKNPLTFESYRELTDFFRACAMDDEVKTIVVTGAGGNFSSGGDVFVIICPLRHGRLCDPAADHRAVAGLGAALYRALHDRGGGRALGLLQPDRHAGAG